MEATFFRSKLGGILKINPPIGFDQKTRSLGGMRKPPFLRWKTVRFVGEKHHGKEVHLHSGKQTWKWEIHHLKMYLRFAVQLKKQGL